MAGVQDARFWSGQEMLLLFVLCMECDEKTSESEENSLTTAGIWFYEFLMLLFHSGYVIYKNIKVIIRVILCIN